MQSYDRDALEKAKEFLNEKQEQMIENIVDKLQAVALTDYIQLKSNGTQRCTDLPSSMIITPKVLDKIYNHCKSKGFKGDISDFIAEYLSVSNITADGFPIGLIAISSKEDSSACSFCINGKCSLGNNAPVNCRKFPIDTGRDVKTKELSFLVDTALATKSGKLDKNSVLVSDIIDEEVLESLNETYDFLENVVEIIKGINPLKAIATQDEYELFTTAMLSILYIGHDEKFIPYEDRLENLKEFCNDIETLFKCS